MDVCWRPLIFRSSSPPFETERLTGAQPSVGRTRAVQRSLVIQAAHRIRNKRRTQVRQAARFSVSPSAGELKCGSSTARGEEMPVALRKRVVVNAIDGGQSSGSYYSRMRRYPRVPLGGNEYSYPAATKTPTSDAPMCGLQLPDWRYTATGTKAGWPSGSKSFHRLWVMLPCARSMSGAPCARRTVIALASSDEHASPMATSIPDLRGGASSRLRSDLADSPAGRSGSPICFSASANDPT
jgi:hypothetical protein